MNTGNTYYIKTNSHFKANPGITLREEPDRWGLLYHPEIDFTLGMNPESVFLWKQLRNYTTIKDITAEIKKHFSNVPGNIEKDVSHLVNGLFSIGFVIMQPTK